MGRSAKSDARLPVAVQALAVVVVAVVATFVTSEQNFRSPANALWMIALPTVLALGLNSSVRQRALMVVALVALSLFTATIVGAVVIGYP